MCTEHTVNGMYMLCIRRQMAYPKSTASHTRSLDDDHKFVASIFMIRRILIESL